MILDYDIEDHGAQVALRPEHMEERAKVILEGEIDRIQAEVRSITPLWQGGLVERVQTKAFDDGLAQTCFIPGVVARVHERNAFWTKQPPMEPLKLWAQGKLGADEKEARSIAFLVGRKIKERGLDLPNVEGRGQMFKRTAQKWAETHFTFLPVGSPDEEFLTREIQATQPWSPRWWRLVEQLDRVMATVRGVRIELTYEEIGDPEIVLRLVRIGA